MGRTNRNEIEYENAFYHIIAKGVQDIDIFTDDVDRNKFLYLLQKTSNLFKIHIFFYVLMDTHFHLLLKTEEANLSQAMQLLNSSYAHWFNIRHIRKGHLFQDRYKSHLILNHLYLYSTASYISLNPVEAGMVNSPEEFPWSSFQYLLTTPDKFIPPWLKIDEFLKLCQISSNNFINFVKENNKKNNLENTLQNFNEVTPSHIQNKLTKNIEHILEKIKKDIGDIETNKQLKHLIIYLLVRENYKIKDISTSLNLARQNVMRISKKIQKKLITDRIYQIWLNQIEKKLFL
jgi:REP element-mobilizing transposase RayT